MTSKDYQQKKFSDFILISHWNVMICLSNQSDNSLNNKKQRRFSYYEKQNIIYRNTFTYRRTSFCRMRPDRGISRYFPDRRMRLPQTERILFFLKRNFCYFFLFPSLFQFRFSMITINQNFPSFLSDYIIRHWLFLYARRFILSHLRSKVTINLQISHLKKIPVKWRRSFSNHFMYFIYRIRSSTWSVLHSSHRVCLRMLYVLLSPRGSI